MSSILLFFQHFHCCPFSNLLVVFFFFSKLSFCNIIFLLLLSCYSVIVTHYTFMLSFPSSLSLLSFLWQLPVSSQLPLPLSFPWLLPIHSCNLFHCLSCPFYHFLSCEPCHYYLSCDNYQFLSCYLCHCRPGSVAQSDARSTGDQEVVNSRLRSGNILLLRLIMKSFLRSFSPFRWFKKGSCQLLAKECALSTG